MTSAPSRRDPLSTDGDKYSLVLENEHVGGDSRRQS